MPKRPATVLHDSPLGNPWAPRRVTAANQLGNQHGPLPVHRVHAGRYGVSLGSFVCIQPVVPIDDEQHAIHFRNQHRFELDADGCLQSKPHGANMFLAASFDSRLILEGHHAGLARLKSVVSFQCLQ